MRHRPRAFVSGALVGAVLVVVTSVIGLAACGPARTTTAEAASYPAVVKVVDTPLTQLYVVEVEPGVHCYLRQNAGMSCVKVRP